MVNKKILIFFPKILYGGIEKNFYWLVSELLKKKIYKIDIITLNKPSTIRIKNKNLNIIQIKNFNNYKENDFFKNFKVFYLLIKFFYKTKKNYSCIISYKSHILILLLCLLYKLKIFIRISNYHGYNKYEKKIYKFIINLIKFKIYKSFSYKVICPSKELSEELKKKFRLKSVWIPNPIQDFLIKNSKKKIKRKKNF